MSVVTWRKWRLKSGSLVAVAIDRRQGAGLATPGEDPELIEATNLIDGLRAIDSAIKPRWIWWSKDTAHALLDVGVRPSICWDLIATHRLLFGGWQRDPGRIWAAAHDLDPGDIPSLAPPDLFTLVREEGNPEYPIRPDGYLRADWVDGGWAKSPERVQAWAKVALEVQQIHAKRLGSRDEDGWQLEPTQRHATAMSESTTEILGAELERNGLPFDRAVAESIIESFVGPRALSPSDEAEQLARRDAEVLQHLPDDADYDLRSPDQVKSMLRRVGIEVPDTRAWRLESLVDAHPVVAPLLEWRQAERIRTTFGYQWIDENVGRDGRLRGSWSGSDGTAGRMTATAGLHNMPSELRPAVVAEPGHVFVRADLGQIEPRILAAVSGDEALARATRANDMYAPVAKQLNVDRETAKLAVLGAMYGQTTGKGAEALAGLEREYPQAMRYLRIADEKAQRSLSLRTYGGRRIQMARDDLSSISEREARSRAAARGRYGRNAMVQGAAAEFFKMWATLVRARGMEHQAQIVLCLHDELIVHVPEDHQRAAVTMVERCLREAAQRWAPRNHQRVEFVADTSVITRWSDAK